MNNGNNNPGPNVPKGSPAQLELDVTKVICGRHGEIFRYRWPTGYPEFVTIALECFFSQPELIARIEQYVKDPANNIGDGCITAANEMIAVTAMLTKKPLCCQLPPRDLYDVLVEVAQKTNAWGRDVCELCGHRGPGARYRKTPPQVQDTAPRGYYRHVCLACVAGVRV